MKEKPENSHELTKKVILYAASADGLTQAAFLPSSLLAVVNARTIGEADTELTNQMEAIGLEEIGWDVSLTQSLRNGQVLYKEVGVPSNFSIFMIKLKDPTRPNEQHARGLDLHLLKVGKDNNKNVLEIVKAGKNQIKVPTHFKDFLTLSKGFMGLSAIVFGTASALTSALMAFCESAEFGKWPSRRRYATTRLSLPRSYLPLILASNCG